MQQEKPAGKKLSTLVETLQAYDEFLAEAMPELLDQATTQVRRFLRETGQWADDVAHEKLALRWGFELLERFTVCGRAEVPCRPTFLLESFIAKYLSQPEPLCYHKELLSPLGRFLDGLTSRAVLSRDALMTLFYHVYGYGQGHVVKLLGLGPVETQRVYKNFERWRRGGWQRAMDEIGMAEEDLGQLETDKAQQPERFHQDADRLLRIVHRHYRKTEPPHFPCLTRQDWVELFEEDAGYDYRVWHLAFCPDCLNEVHEVRRVRLIDVPVPKVEVHIRPLSRGRGFPLGLIQGGAGNGNSGTRPSQHISATSA